MKCNGFLIIQKEKAARKNNEFVQCHYYLFGRIVRIKRTVNYFYPGVFHENPYFKFGNGCYFSMNKIENFKNYFEILEANIDIGNRKFKTGRDIWLKRIKKNKTILQNPWVVDEDFE